MMDSRMLKAEHTECVINNNKFKVYLCDLCLSEKAITLN